MEHEASQFSRQPSDAEPQRNVGDFLHNEFHFPAIDLYIERTLTRTGWLATLEQAGIVPVVDDPNPFDMVQDKTAYAQWWDEHPDVLASHEEQLTIRRTILKYLHIGAILGHLDGARLYPARNFPDIEIS